MKKSSRTLQEILPDMELKLYEEFPHVAQKLALFWNSPFFNDYIDNLVAVERSGRQGFPFHTLMELQKVIDKHEEMYPEFKRQRSIWV